MSFNGAALRRARRSQEILRVFVGSGLLQWGRAQASAEMPQQAKDLLKAAVLQWGRAQASAEISGSGLGPGCDIRFNGAALRRARRCSRCKSLVLNDQNQP